MLDHVVDACCQLDPEKSKRSIINWVISEALPTWLSQQAIWLPDALRGVDDGLHNVVSNELPVLVRDVIDSYFRARAVSITPVLSYHVLQVNHT